MLDTPCAAEAVSGAAFIASLAANRLPPDCSASVVKGISSGCNPSINPGGEIGAGGNGVDACFGDSGGPLYLPTPRGSFLIGVTSRSYDGASPSYPCRDGGLYARPDASLAWMEKVMGAPLEHPQCGEPPAPLADPIPMADAPHRPASRRRLGRVAALLLLALGALAPAAGADTVRPGCAVLGSFSAVAHPGACWRPFAADSPPRTIFCMVHPTR